MSVLPRGFGGGQRGTAATRREVSLHTVGCTYVLYRQFNDCVIQTGLTVWDLLSPPLPPTHETNRLEKEGSTPPAQRRCRRCTGGWGGTPFTPLPAVCAHTHCVARGRGSPSKGRPTPRRAHPGRASPPPSTARPLPWLFHGWRAVWVRPPPGRGGLLGDGPPPRLAAVSVSEGVRGCAGSASSSTGRQ